MSPYLDIYLSEDAEDVVFDSYAATTQFGTAVCYPLEDTMALCKTADFIRKAVGHRPMFSGSESEMDLEGWYSFYIYVTKHDTVSDIEFIVHNTAEDDEEKTYWILLSDDDKKEIFYRLNKLSSMKVGYTCNRLLDILKERWA